jgi:Sortase domain
MPARGALRWVAGLAGLTVLGAGLAGCSAAGAAGPTGMAGPPAAAGPSTPVADGFKSSRDFREVAVPVRLRIPRIGINSALERLGKARDGSIALPSKAALAGWYAGGPRPGQRGPAVIIGHVDWDHGPAVFFRLAELRPGDRVEVGRADGSTVFFTVTSLQQVPKAEFPTDLVYAPSLVTSLRLVTCGGSFDRTSHSYRDNVIVSAVQK